MEYWAEDDFGIEPDGWAEIWAILLLNEALNTLVWEFDKKKN